MPPDTIFHITLVDNLPSIVASGGLYSDAAVRDAATAHAAIGSKSIKDRRMELLVPCHERTVVGEYVPFFYCPRSIMLFLIHKRNPMVPHRGGQDHVVHLAADLGSVMSWCDQNGVPWAIADGNAASAITKFSNNRATLAELDMKAINAHLWSESPLRERKQAEFLVYREFPWHLVNKIGVKDDTVRAAVRRAIAAAVHKPPVVIEPTWYYP